MDNDEQPVTPQPNSVKPEAEKPLPQVAVWYFVAATFVCSAPSFFSVYATTPLRIGSIVIGLLLLVLGMRQLKKELALAAEVKSEEDRKTQETDS